MTDRTHLKVVAPGDGPKAKPTPKSISEALDGTGRDVLAAMRKALARKLDDGDVSSNAIASAYKELRELDRLIRQIDRAIDEEQSATRIRRDDTFDASAI